jgi:hypothetical protein
MFGTRALAISLVLATSVAAVPRGVPITEYRVYFPKLALSPDEQIREFTVSVACGHIERLNHVPDDWNVEISRAVSAVETLHASAVRANDERCFGVSALVVVTFDNDRTIRLSSAQLRLVLARKPPNER